MGYTLAFKVPSGKWEIFSFCTLSQRTALHAAVAEYGAPYAVPETRRLFDTGETKDTQALADELSFLTDLIPETHPGHAPLVELRDRVGVGHPTESLKIVQ